MNVTFDGPHKCYGFNIYPNNISEYSKYIDQLDQFKVENVEDVDKIYEMYAMRYIMVFAVRKYNRCNTSSRTQL